VNVLKARVAGRLPNEQATDIMFVDADIQTGDVWTQRSPPSVVGDDRN
jgi:hypothetical protein